MYNFMINFNKEIKIGTKNIPQIQRNTSATSKKIQKND